jgi:hypothetical protein
VLFNYAGAAVLGLTPSTAASTSLAPPYIAVNASNVPLTDPRFRVELVFGNVVYQPDGTTLNPAGPCTNNLCPQPWMQSISVPFTNDLRFPLPIGAGGQRFVQVKVTNIATGVARYSLVTANALFSYSNPRVSAVVLGKARFIGFNGVTAADADAQACPFNTADTALNSAWNCANGALVQVTLTGSSFGQLLGGASTALQLSGDGVLHSLTLQPFSTGMVYSA